MCSSTIGIFNISIFYFLDVKLDTFSLFWLDEFKNFFSKYGKVVEHEIIRDHATKRSRGFGFIVFDSDQVVDNILVDGNMIDMSGTQVCSIQWFPTASDLL